MALDYAGRATLAADPTFQAKTRLAMTKAAIKVLEEDAFTAAADVYCEERAAFARQVVQNPEVWAPRFVSACACRLPVDDANPTDGVLNNAAEKAFNAMAGIPKRLLPPA